MKKFMKVIAIVFGLLGALLETLAAYRLEYQFTEAGVRLGYPPEHMTWFWRHCTLMGFVLITLAFFLELVILFLEQKR